MTFAKRKALSSTQCTQYPMTNDQSFSYYLQPAARGLQPSMNSEVVKNVVYW
jgi:hypothetical protein